MVPSGGGGGGWERGAGGSLRPTTRSHLRVITELAAHMHTIRATLVLNHQTRPDEHDDEEEERAGKIRTLSLTHSQVQEQYRWEGGGGGGR